MQKNRDYLTKGTLKETDCLFQLYLTWHLLSLLKDNLSVLITILCREKGLEETMEIKSSSESCMNFVFQNY